MTPVDQTIFTDAERGQVGDCWRACIASLLDISCDALPHFVAESGHQYEAATRAWLADRGYYLWRTFRASRNGQYAIYGYTGSHDRNRVTEITASPYMIVGGASPRSGRHCVIAHTEKLLPFGCWGEDSHFEEWMAHDPHPSRVGILSRDEVFAVVPA